MGSQTKQLKIQIVTGKSIDNYVEDLARLRIEVFYEYPYLYEGSIDYETDYLSHYAKSPQSIIVLATENSSVIGASTGKLLLAETANIQQPWKDNNYDLSTIFYFGESVLKKEYRGLGIGKRFFEEREKWALQHANFKTCTFCAVVRPDNHSLKPADYRPLDAFWSKKGYEKQERLHCKITWLDRGENNETAKKLVFWKKDIR